MGLVDSCSTAGAAYSLGIGAKKDFELSESYFEKACKMQSHNGCLGLVALGAMYESGEGVKQNLSKAKELYGKSCNLSDIGNLKGCALYKKLNDEGVK